MKQRGLMISIIQMEIIRWGFCRRLMWLSVATMNNNPVVIANQFLDTIAKRKTTPRIPRIGLGIKNIYCQDI